MFFLFKRQVCFGLASFSFFLSSWTSGGSDPFCDSWQFDNQIMVQLLVSVVGCAISFNVAVE